MRTIQIEGLEKDTIYSNFWDPPYYSSSHLFVSIDCIHLLLWDTLNSELCKSISGSDHCVIARGIDTYAQGYFQIDFYKELEELIEAKSGNLVPNYSPIGTIMIPVPDDKGYNEIDIDWRDTLCLENLHIWASNKSDGEGRLVSKMDARLMRVDTIPTELAPSVLCDADIKDLPYPWLDLDYLPYEEAIEWDESSTAGEPIYNLPLWFNMNNGRKTILLCGKNPIFPNSPAIPKKDLGIHFSEWGVPDSRNWFGLSAYHRDSPDDVLAYVSILTDKRMQDEFFTDLVHLFYTRALGEDIDDREEPLSVDVIGTIPIIGIVFTENLDRSLQGDLEAVAMCESVELLKRIRPSALREK